MHTYDWQLAGHESQRKRLEIDLNAGNLAHAYLFYGPPEVGKFRLAKTFANILQCSSGLCGTCPTCIQIDKNCHYDTLVMADNDETIKIEEVQHLIGKLATTSQSNFKIVIIEDVERMTLPAANCLLKTLEEPGENTVFLLTTNDISNVLDTVKSRSRLVKFSQVSNAELEVYLSKSNIVVDEQVKIKAKAFAFGSIGKFFRLMLSADDLRETKELYDVLVNLLQGAPLSSKFRFVAKIAEDKEKVKKVLEMLTHILRSMLLAKTGHGQHLHELPELLCDYSIDHLLSLTERIESLKRDLEHNVNTKLLLESVLLQV